LSDIYIREAKEKFGIKFAITTDAHNTNGLTLIELGIGQARRGWLSKSDVINTLKLAEYRKAIKSK
jgi:DNA polymerase (family 10)